MDRRQFLATTGLAATGLAGGAALAPVPAFAQGKPPAAATPGDAKLNALLEKIFMDRVKRNPSFATGLGLDKGPLAGLKSQFDTRPVAQARREDLALSKRELAQVRGVNPATLSTAGKLNREVVLVDQLPLCPSTVAIAVMVFQLRVVTGTPKSRSKLPR